MELTFPKKGWNTNEARFSQPEGTSPSLLNVLAFDRENRSRGGQRPGTSKLYAAALGNGAQPVLSMLQVTRALDPSTITPNTLLLNYDFTAIPVATRLNVWPSSGSPDWRVTGGYNSGNGAATVNDKLFLASVAGTATCQGTDINTGWDNGQYNPGLSLGAAYIIKATFVMTSTGNAANQNIGYRIMFRFDPGWANGLALEMTRDRIWLMSNIGPSNGGGAELTHFSFASTLAGGLHTLELHVNGDSISGWVDGVQYISFTTSSLNANSGFGFGIATNAGNDGIRLLQVYIGAPLALYRQTNTVISCGGTLYVGDILTQPTAAAGGSNILSSTIKTQMSTSQGNVYVTDGVHNLKKLVMSTLTVADIVPTAGSETATTLGAYQLTCIWRDRLVLAASNALPQNFIMSRQGTHTDFDYAQLDAAAAVAGNASKAGAIGEPLNCLVPFSDDILILGGDHSVYKVEGDIAAGGQILTLSDSIGTLGPDCWDADPSGNLYFVGTMGLFRMQKGSNNIEDVSQGRIKDFFVNINRTAQYVVCAWDRDRHGLWIFVTPVNSGAAVHLFYDSINDAFFPIQYPNAHGPITAITYDGDGPTDRVLLLAGRDGFIRKWDASATTDDGTAITSYVYIGPIRPILKYVGGSMVPDEQALGILTFLDVIFGEPPSGFSDSDWTCQIQVQTGKDAYTAFASPQATLATVFTQSVRRKKILQRISGGVYYFLVSNNIANKIWQLEKLSCDFMSGGMQRRW